MKKELAKLLAILITGLSFLPLFFLIMPRMAFAGDSVSIAMSCTIPAIPGVNAPPFAENKTKPTPDETVAAKELPETKKETPPKAPSIIQAELTREVRLTADKAPVVTVQTFYYR